MTGTKRDSGKKGGLVTLERYGKDQLRTWGKLGGRPRDKSYNEIRQQQRQERNNNHKEGMGPPGGNLRTLKTLYKLSHRSSGIGENEQAGLADETPQGQVPAGKEAR